jgi:hypothetical protein
VTAKHAAPQDASLRTSLLKHLGGGAALVLLVAVGFYGIGQVGQDTGAPVAADLPDEPEDEEAEEPEDEEAEEPEDVEAPDEPDEAEEPEPEEEAEEEAEESEEQDEPDEAEGVEEPEEDSGEPEPAPAAAYEPSEIVLQVLDGVGTDGGNAASQMAQRLRDGGYDVIAQNPALAYEVTTVLWTSGNEDKARQVAAAIGAGDVRPQPGNLSESVDVHVVVGADRA